MNFNQYVNEALRTAPPETDPYEDLLHGCAGLSTETGELVDVIKKHRYYGKPVDWVNVFEEMGDVLWYLALLCRAADTTLEEVAEANIAKLRARYPEKFTTEHALNRDTDAERRVLEDPSYVALKESQEERE